MIDFFIFDSTKYVSDIIINTIHQLISHFPIPYKIFLFDTEHGYGGISIDGEFVHKVYFLILGEHNYDDIGFAKKIRMQDPNGILIFILKKDSKRREELIDASIIWYSILVLDDSLSNRIYHCLTSYIQMLHKNQVIHLESKNTIIHIELNHIVLIMTEPLIRKCTIKTENSNFSVPLSLSELQMKLDNRFVKIHKSCIINKEKIVKIDKKNRIITLSNGIETDLVARDYKKKLNIP